MKTQYQQRLFEGGEGLVMEDPKAMMMMGKTQMGGGGEQEQQQLKCPRCESTNTKFCYYNNYNLSQPRHFCKACRRYWTVGGALRNIPVGGATRKPHRPSSSSSKRHPKPAPMPPPPTTTATYKLDEDQCMLPGSYSSLLASNGQLGSLMDSMFSGESAAPAVQFGDFPAESCNFDGGMVVGDASCWAGVSGWPDLAIYTPGSSFDQ